MALELPTWDELFLIMPEICLVLGMCAVILVPFINRRSHAWPTFTAFGFLVMALGFALATLDPGQSAWAHEAFNVLVVDPFSQFFKVMLILFTLFIIILWMIATRHETHVYDAPDFHCLLLGATFGMALMASANHLLMIFIATEMASLPSFALAGFRKRHRVSSESSLKYVIFGAAASAIMLYGMSLIYGTTGSLALTTVASRAAADVSPLLVVGLIAMFVGIAFKLSAVPLHFWCPDVFEGAAFEVTTFLSVASKGAAVALLVRILFVFGGMLGPGDSGFVGLAVGVAILGGVTATWGNLLAYHQTNIKRLLAYSSIAHAGYMIMAASLMVLVRNQSDPTLGLSLRSALLFYLLVYMFMNLGAFTVAATIQRCTGSEDIRDYAALARRAPHLTVLMCLFLLSLFGMPGLGGFMGKIYLMKAMADVGGTTAGLALVAVVLANTLISLYYYMRPIYYMVLVPDTEDRPRIAPQAAGLATMLLCAVALVWTGLRPNSIHQKVADYSHMFSGATPQTLGRIQPGVRPADQEGVRPDRSGAL